MLKLFARILPGGGAGLETKLDGVAGFTGGGDFTYSTRRGGHRAYKIELRGIAGKAADLYVSGIKITSIELTDGRAARKFDTKRGDPTPRLSADDLIEIRQNGSIILTGVLTAQ